MNIHKSLLSCKPAPEDNAAPRDIDSAADVGWFPLRRGDRCSAALSVLRTGAPSEQMARRLTEQRSILASELEAAQKQIASLKGRVAQSSEEKRGLSDTIELVDLVLTPWRRLPDSIVMMIFDIVIGSSESGGSTVSSVCRRWRRLAEKSPGLWVRVHICARTPVSSERSRYLTELLGRSDALPLRVRLSGMHWGRLDRLWPFARRIETLDLRMPAGTASTSLPPPTNLPKLKQVTISMWSTDTTHVDVSGLMAVFQDAPKLDSFEIRTKCSVQSLDKQPIPWTQLTTVHLLTPVTGTVYRHVFTCCPALADCLFLRVIPDNHSVVVFPPLDSLRSLSLGFGEKSLLDPLASPNLVKLHLGLATQTPDSLGPFALRSLFQLRSLSIVGVFDDARVLTEFLVGQPRLEELVLSRAAYWQDIFGVFVSESSPFGVADLGLSFLRTITFDVPVESADAPELVSLLESLGATMPNRPFPSLISVSISHRQPVFGLYTERQRKVLKQLVRRGFVSCSRRSDYQEIDSDQESDGEEGSEVDSRDWEMDGEDSSEDDGRDRETSGEDGSDVDDSDREISGEGGSDAAASDNQGSVRGSSSSDDDEESSTDST
ncbi:hypothetical protein C8R43DRAFT_942760 [Mycena crocata]|nr:hypothetical protein C8R43DRAFT_942760 [Mycena crocata]